jgi:predicted metal-dependent hydrolase
MYQLELSFEQNRDALRDYLENATGKTINLSITDNTVSMLSIKKLSRNKILMRLHWMFLHADNDVIGELIHFVRDKNVKTPSIVRFVHENRKHIRDRTCKPPRVNVKGKYHNLIHIFDFLNKRYFGERIKASITWGRKRYRWYKGKRTLGSYDFSTDIIRINPFLDKKNVPRYFLEFVVYHEMIHADMHSKKDEGRRLIHTKEFKRREQLFEKYKKSILWEERCLG